MNQAWKDQLSPEATLGVDTIGNLRRLGWDVWSFEQNRRTRQTPGISDLLVRRRELLVAIELKVGAGEVSDHQWMYLEAFIETGNYALACWSWPEVAWGLARVVPTVEGWIPEEAVPDEEELSGRFKEAIVRLYPRFKGVLR